MYAYTLALILSPFCLFTTQKVCGVHDFTMKDILTPDPKRVRRHLSAIINFAKFREERLVMYSELAVKVKKM